MNKVYKDSDEFLKSLTQDNPTWLDMWYAVQRHVSALRHAPRQLKYKVQRAQRGWSDQDTWGLDLFLTDVIVGGVEQLRKTGLSHGVTDSEEWDTVLRDIVSGFKLRQGVVRDFRVATPEDVAAMDRAWDLLRLHFSDLWD